MTNLTLQHINPEIPSLKAEFVQLFGGTEIEFLSISEEKYSPANKLPHVFLKEDLHYPEHNEYPIVSVVKLGSIFACFAGNFDREQLNILKEKDIRKTYGKVYLVGAGQNHKDHLTLKANRLLQEADIILYDSLIDSGLLENLDAELVFVGKRAGTHYKEQKDINQLLFEAAQKHQTVVRVKGGDPMIFGRAGEEIAFLEQNFVQVEVVPGISSALSAAALTKTALTLRYVSNSVAFCSAHQKSRIEVPNTDTIVYFMGAGNMKGVANSLIETGRDKNTPAKLIYNIGGEDEEVYTETLNSILKREMPYKAPLLAIIGEVADKRNYNKAFAHKPKVLFTGTNISKYVHLGYVMHQPMIELTELSDYSNADSVICNLKLHNWILFTSAYAVKYFFKRVYELGFDSRILNGITIGSIGHFTSGKLKKHGIVPDFQAEKESSEGIIEYFSENQTSTQLSILIPRSDLAHNTLPNGLELLGHKVNALTIYRNTKPKIDKKYDVEGYEQIIFTSPSGVNNFVDIYGKLPVKPKLVSKGKETQKAIDRWLKKDM